MNPWDMAEAEEGLTTGKTPLPKFKDVIAQGQAQGGPLRGRLGVPKMLPQVGVKPGTLPATIPPRSFAMQPNMARGFTMGAQGPLTIDAISRPVPPTPPVAPQAGIGYTPQAAGAAPIAEAAPSVAAPVANAAKTGLFRGALGILGRTAVPASVATTYLPWAWGKGTEGKPDYTGTPNDYDYDVPAELTRPAAGSPRDIKEKAESNTPWPIHPNAAPDKEMQSPLAPFDFDKTGYANVDGNKIAYGDIGNPLKDAALINGGRPLGGGLMGGNVVSPGATSVDDRANSAFTPEGVEKNKPQFNAAGYAMPASPGGGGAGGLGGILDTINRVEPVQDMGTRMANIQSGNRTWDMSGLGQLMAAKAGQRADENRYTQQTGALAHIGAAQLAAEAARQNHMMTLAQQQETNRLHAPLITAQTKNYEAEAAARPIHAQIEALKALQEQHKNNPALVADLKSIESKVMNPADYNAFAKNIARQHGIFLTPMPIEG